MVMARTEPILSLCLKNLGFLVYTCDFKRVVSCFGFGFTSYSV